VCLVWYGRASYCATPLHDQLYKLKSCTILAVALPKRLALTTATVAHSTTTPIASDSGSVSPTLVASLPGTPSDLSLSAPSQVADISVPSTPLASAITTGRERDTADSDSDEEYNYVPAYSPPPEESYLLAAHSIRKRRRVDDDYLIDVAYPRPSKLLRQSLVDPAADHDIMRYNGHTDEPGPSGSTSSLANGDGSNRGLATNGYATKSPVPLVRPAWSTLYKDSQVDREQVVRTVLQALRDVGYA
jgi:hypothetical protein